MGRSVGFWYRRGRGCLLAKAGSRLWYFKGSELGPTFAGWLELAWGHPAARRSWPDTLLGSGRGRISALKVVDRGDRRYGGLHVVRRLIVMVDNHKADTTEEQNAVERTYPASPLVVFVKVCGRCDFLEQHALHKFLHEEGRPATN